MPSALIPATFTRQADNQGRVHEFQRLPLVLNVKYTETGLVAEVEALIIPGEHGQGIGRAADAAADHEGQGMQRLAQVFARRGAALGQVAKRLVAVQRLSKCVLAILPSIRSSVAR